MMRDRSCLTFNWEICVSLQYLTELSISERVPLLCLVDVQHIASLAVHVTALLNL